MAYIHHDNKTIELKIVYYGPGRSGKTTTLRHIRSRYQKVAKTGMGSIQTLDEQAMFFDFLPLDVGKKGDYNVKVGLYTVPGQSEFDATRRLVLKGVDGVVFVADSMTARREKNVLSLKSLKENLSHIDKNPSHVPLVFQYNKRDLEKLGISILPISVLEEDLNREIGAPYFKTSSKTGENVFAAMKSVISLTLASVKKELDI